MFTYDENNNARHYNLANYSVSGLRRVNWFVDGIEKYHRTFSDIINPLVAAGFQIEKMLEPIPCDDEIACDNSLREHLHRPLFLLIKARRT